MNNILEQVQASEVTAVSTDYVPPKADYALKVEKVDVVTSDSGFTRVAWTFLVEDVYNADPSIDISKLVGKKMMHSIPLFSDTEENLKESLGKVRHAAENCGADKETQGSLMALVESCVGKTSIHSVYPRTGKDNVTRAEITWTAKKPKAE